LVQGHATANPAAKGPELGKFVFPAEKYSCEEPEGKTFDCIGAKVGEKGIVSLMLLGLLCFEQGRLRVHG
jgi:hypothetical protein